MEGRDSTIALVMVRNRYQEPSCDKAFPDLCSGRLEPPTSFSDHLENHILVAQCLELQVTANQIWMPKKRVSYRPRDRGALSDCYLRSHLGSFRLRFSHLSSKPRVKPGDEKAMLSRRTQAFSNALLNSSEPYSYEREIEVGREAEAK